MDTMTIMMITIIVCSAAVVLFGGRKRIFRKRRYDPSEENPWDQLLGQNEDDPKNK